MRRWHGQAPDTGMVGAPDPSAEFLGFERQLTWYPRGISHGTKELVALVAACAGALVASGGEYVTGKKQALARYAELQDTKFGRFCDQLYSHCCEQWEGLIPSRSSERRELRAHCVMALEFENYVLQRIGRSEAGG